MPKKNLVRVEEGVCPKCGCKELDYGCSHADSGQMYYDWDCPQCQESGREWYTLTFNGHTVPRGDGTQEEFNA